MRIAAIDESATGGRSWLHRASPKTKLAAFALVLAAVVVSWNLLVVLGVALALAAVAESARLPRRDVYALAFYPGLFALVFAFAAAPDVLTGALFVSKAVTAALAAVILVFTTPYPQVFAPIQAVTPTLVGDALLLTYRSLFLLLEKFLELTRAVRLRSGLSGRQPLQAARATTRSLGGLLVYSLDLAQRDYDVMRLRGYEGRLRALLPRAASPAADALLLAAAAGVLAVSALWRLDWETLNPYSWLATLGGLGALIAATLVRVLEPGTRR